MTGAPFSYLTSQIQISPGVNVGQMIQHIELIIMKSRIMRTLSNEELRIWELT